MSTIGDPRKAGEEGKVGDTRKAGEEGIAGDPRPAGRVNFTENDEVKAESKPTKKAAKKA